MNHGFAISDWSADLAAAGAAVAAPGGELAAAAAGSHAAGVLGMLGRAGYFARVLTLKLCKLLCLTLCAVLQAACTSQLRSCHRHIHASCALSRMLLSCCHLSVCSSASLHLPAEAARVQVAAAAARGTRIPNRCDLRVYAVTDPDCNAQFGRTNAGG